MRRLTTFSAMVRSSQLGADFGSGAASSSAMRLPEGARATASDAPTRPPPTTTMSWVTSVPATLRAHQRFDVGHFLADVGGQHARAGVGDQDVVLDAHADAVEFWVDALGARRNV